MSSTKNIRKGSVIKKNTIKQINSLKSSFKPQALLKNKFLLLNYEEACNNALTEFPKLSDYITLQKAWNTKVLEVLHSKINPESNIVSIGSFLGSVEIALAKSTHEIVCCDLESYLPKKLPNNVKFHEVNIDSNNLNLPERHFDICLCIELLEHLRYSPIPMLDWIKNNCNLLVISTPDDDEWPSVENKPWTTKAHFGSIPFAKKGDQGNPTPMNHCKQYSQFEFVELLHRMDFRIEEICRIGEGGHQMLVIASPRISKSNVNAIKQENILRAELEATLKQENILRAELKATLNSNSWKHTKPLRTIIKFSRKFF